MAQLPFCLVLRPIRIIFFPFSHTGIYFFAHPIVCSSSMEQSCQPSHPFQLPFPPFQCESIQRFLGHRIPPMTDVMLFYWILPPSTFRRISSEIRPFAFPNSMGFSYSLVRFNSFRTIFPTVRSFLHFFATARQSLRFPILRFFYCYSPPFTHTSISMLVGNSLILFRNAFAFSEL